MYLLQRVTFGALEYCCKKCWMAAEVDTLILQMSSLNAHIEPYHDIPRNAAVIAKVLEGYHQPKSSNCSDEVYNLLERCWEMNADKRPSFEEILKELDALSTQANATSGDYVY
jgi:hypothetical protein